MRCVQISWVFILFYFMSLSKVKPKLKTTCFDWGKQNKHLNLFYFQHLQLPHSKTDQAEIWREASIALKLNSFNFEANPTVDLRETINQAKSPEASP
jgi:hypothetical protein